MDCSICTYAKANGWWGPELRSGTHCRDCHRSWTGLKEIHCVLCCKHFSTPENLDKHKTSAGKCKDPARLKKQDGTPVLMEVQRKSGSVWVGWQESLSTFGVSPANEEEVA